MIAAPLHCEDWRFGPPVVLFRRYPAKFRTLQKRLMQFERLVDPTQFERATFALGENPGKPPAGERGRAEPSDEAGMAYWPENRSSGWALRAGAEGRGPSGQFGPPKTVQTGEGIRQLRLHLLERDRRRPQPRRRNARHLNSRASPTPVRPYAVPPAYVSPLAVLSMSCQVVFSRSGAPPPNCKSDNCFREKSLVGAQGLEPWAR